MKKILQNFFTRRLIGTKKERQQIEERKKRFDVAMKLYKTHIISYEQFKDSVCREYDFYDGDGRIIE